METAEARTSLEVSLRAQLGSARLDLHHHLAFHDNTRPAMSSRDRYAIGLSHEEAAECPLFRQHMVSTVEPSEEFITAMITEVIKAKHNSSLNLRCCAQCSTRRPFSPSNVTSNAFARAPLIPPPLTSVARQLLCSRCDAQYYCSRECERWTPPSPNRDGV